MTDQERKQCRLARKRRMGKNKWKQSKTKNNRSGLFAFRSYVTVVLAGAFLLLSVLRTETSMAVCEEVKEVIAYQIPMEDLTKAKDLLQAFFLETEDGGIPVFYENKVQVEDIPASGVPEEVEITTKEMESTTEEVFQYAPDIYDSP